MDKIVNNSTKISNTCNCGNSICVSKPLPKGALASLLLLVSSSTGQDQFVIQKTFRCSRVIVLDARSENSRHGYHYN